MTEHRRGEPDTRYVRTIDDQQVKLVANEDGVITVSTGLEQRLADQLGLPVTQLPKMSTKEVAALQKATAEKEAD